MSFSHSGRSIMSIAFQGQPSRYVPSGPLDVHFLQPMHLSGSTQMRWNVGAASFTTRTMQSSTGHRSWQTGEPEQPVQLSLMVARIFGFRLRLSVFGAAMVEIS